MKNVLLSVASNSTYIPKMVPLSATELDSAVTLLKEYRPESAIPRLAGLLTMPEFQASTMRIETLVHLAVAHCKGRSPLTPADINELLNDHLGNTRVTLYESSPEDVFVTNIETQEGNFLLFQSVWESSDYFLQVFMDVLGDPRAPGELKDLLVPALALLTLSDCVAKRVGLQRWSSVPSVPNKPVTLPQESLRITDHAKAVTFTIEELNALGIGRDKLTPFIFDHDNHTLGSEKTGNSSLERCPLVDLRGDMVLALPNAVSSAIRRLVTVALQKTGYQDQFTAALAGCHAEQIAAGLWGLRDNVEFIPDTPALDMDPLWFHALILRYDSDKYIHIVQLYDQIDCIYKNGFDSFQRYSNEQEKNLLQYLSHVSNYYSSLPGVSEGFTLIIFGSLGRGIVLNTPDLPDNWHFSLLSIPDLLTLGFSSGNSVRSYLKFIKYKKWAENRGFSFLSPNEDFKLFCYWHSNEHRLVPRQMPTNQGVLVIATTEFVQEIREEVRILADRHAIRTVDGNNIPVIRLATSSYFPSLRSMPIFVSLRHSQRGELVGAVETPRGPSWLVITNPSDPMLRDQFGYSALDGFINVYARLVLKIEEEYTGLASDPISVHLNFKEVLASHDPNETYPSQPEIRINPNHKTAEIKFPPDIMKHFMDAENVGEKMIARCVIKSIMHLFQIREIDQINEGHVAKISDHVLGDSGIRIIHSFLINHPLEYLQLRRAGGCIDISGETLNFRRMSLSEGCNVKKNAGVIESRSECNKFLHCVVDKVRKHMQTRLKAFNRTDLISGMYELYEACLSDREYWRRTAKTTASLYGDTDCIPKIFGQQEKDRTEVSISIRTILEMAICECPASGGKKISSWEVDDLLADAHLLIETAMHSDAVHKNLANPKIELHANGEFSIDTSAYREVVDPFFDAFGITKLNEAVERYNEFYRSESASDGRMHDDIWPARFVDVFRTEFGLLPNDVLECFIGLLEMAIEYDSLVVTTTFGEIRNRLTRRDGLTSDSCEAFVRTFGIFHRAEWDKPPTGFGRKDIYPWRFRRRLSATAKPILVFGQQDKDPVIFGIGALWLGCCYLLHRTENGLLPDDFYRSLEMKRYLGEISNEKGHAFARSVSQEMHKRGWHVKNEVMMSSLGAPRELGDVDVLAWRSDGRVLVIECKCVQLARTVVEIAEICERFQGEAKDELDKHLQRVKWIKNHLASLKRIIGYIPDSDNIDDRLVTSRQVPMKYRESLPIDTIKIGQLEEIM